MNGPVRVMATVDASPNKHSPNHDDGRQHDVCPFAAAISFAVPSSGSTLAPSTLAESLVTHPAVPRFVEPDTHYSLQAPRAPPIAA
ncbi:MAG: hypothetical protein P4L57_12305 [Rhizomicrobium sp.]|nr:hypothetical protein [Rhizomicrobium sp.]